VKRIILITTAAILLVIGATFLFNDKPNQSMVELEPIALSIQIKAANGQIIDVREPFEYKSSHADGAINVPLGDILKADFSKIDKERPAYVYCRTGSRASQAKIALEQAGYKDVINIGGLADWQNQGDKVCNTINPSC